MTEESAETSESQLNEGSTAVEVGAGVVAALVSLAFPEPVRGVVAHGLAPLLAGVEKIFENWNEIRKVNATQVIDDAANALGMSPEEFFEAVKGDPRLLSLAGQAMNVAASTVLQQKIRTLGKLVADGVRDDARVDESVMFLAALEDLEAPHIALLIEMGKVFKHLGQAEPVRLERGEADQRANYRSYNDLKRGMARFGVGLRPAIATLERHGLIEVEETDFNKLFGEYDKEVQRRGQTSRFTNFRPNIPTMGWRITEFGLALRDHLDEQGRLATPVDTAGDQSSDPAGGARDTNR